jgi:Domain of unknown function (DUF5134)
LVDNAIRRITHVCAMIHDLLLRWIVTALFVLSAAESAYAIATGRRVWTNVVGLVLHLVMAVAMAIMAWPWGAALPTTGPMVFFLLATAWYVAVAFAVVDHRAVNGYHGLMMLAMAWMYAVMNGQLLPGQSGAGRHTTAAAAAQMSMPGMNMSSAGASAQDGGGYQAWIAVLNWLCTIAFAVAAVWWLYRYFARRQAEPTQPSHRFLGVASQAMMAAGMAIMFGVML